MLETEKSNQKIQCHFITNTHWDREWRYSAQRTRYMLGYVLDMLFDIFEKEPGFKHFHLDSQTLPLQDYLEAYPEKAELIKKYVSEGKLAVGPWFCLPDEFCVGGESLVRNLLIGHKIAKQFGAVSKTGYSPFGWGQISQMPQIYGGFGIDVISFYRGLNKYVTPKSEFVWESPDGTRAIASRLGARPRYNVWYIIQRPVYFNQKNENNRNMSWKDGGAPFKFIDEDKCGIDYQYAHPYYQYLKENIKERAEQAIAEQDADWSQPHRFWSNGHDSSCPDIREAKMISDCNKALSGKADVFHSTVKAWQDGLKENYDPNWPVIKGEMRNNYTKGISSTLFGWITSSRMDVKLANFKTEREITAYAEPMAVFASILGAPYPENFVNLSYNYLLQNHGHDSIAGCGRDIVSDDVIYRYRQSREISDCIIERAMMDIAGSIDLSAYSTQDIAIVVYNPAPYQRDEVLALNVEIPNEWNAKGFEIYDGNDGKVETQLIEKIANNYDIIQSPNDVANVMPSSRYCIRADMKEIPSYGYKTFIVKPLKAFKNETPKTLRTADYAMENEYFSVSINANGTINVFDKTQKRMYENLGYFRDSSEIGNPWEHITTQNDSVFTTLNERAEVSLVRDGKLEVTYKIKYNWRLPEGRSGDELSRSSHFEIYRIENTVTLRKGQKWVEIVTEVDNNVEDHYLQVVFPTGIQSDQVMAQGQFDVIKRSIKKPDYTLYDEIPMTEAPMNSFVDISDGKDGLALLNEGLKAYEASDDTQEMLSLTLLRCYPLRICVTQNMQDYSKTDKGSQCQGKHKFRYAIMPHSGCYEAGKVWQASDEFNLRLHAAQIGPTKHGTEAMEKSFVKFTKAGLSVSAVKKSEDGDGWVIRIFNPFEHTVKNSVLFNGGYAEPDLIQSPVERVQAEFKLPPKSNKKWRKVSVVSLEELPQKELAVNEDGYVDFEITQKQILTLKFVK